LRRTRAGLDHLDILERRAPSLDVSVDLPHLSRALFRLLFLNRGFLDRAALLLFILLNNRLDRLVFFFN
jgi:hypothetical protein